MDEYNQGWDPEVREFFRKIMNSFGLGLFWLLTAATAGLFFKLAIIKNRMHWYNLLFYGLFLATMVLVIVLIYRIWRKKQ